MIAEEQGLTLVLDDEQQMLRKTAVQFVREHAPVSRLRQYRHFQDADGFSRQLWKEMAELGWLGLHLPEQYGGLGLGIFDLCIVLEAAGRNLMPEPFLSTALQGAYALLLGGTKAQKQEWLPAIAAGQKLLTIAEYEPSARGDIAQNVAVASKSSTGYRITGEKHHVLDVHVADLILVLARTSGATGERQGLTLFAIDPGAKGVSIDRQDRIDDRNAGIVRLDDVAVGADSVVGGLDTGSELFESVMERTWVGLAAETLGASEQAFETTVAYLKERVQFDVPIGSFQALQHRAARLYIEIALARSTVAAAARAIDEGRGDASRLASLAKFKASETFSHVAKEAIQMHGGIGMTDEHNIGFYFKRSHAALMSFGDPAFHKKRWASLSGY